jgi:AraC family transcriptional regulator
MAGISARRQAKGKVSIIPPHQLHQLNWLHGADLTLFRLAPEFVKDLAYQSGMKGVEIIGQYGAFDPVIWHLGREMRGELRRHRDLDTGYLNSVAVVLARHLLSTHASAVRLSTSSGGLPRYKLRLAVEYINDNIVEDIGFRDIAAHLKMSAYHFARMFKQSTGSHRIITSCVAGWSGQKRCLLTPGCRFQMSHSRWDTKARVISPLVLAD